MPARARRMVVSGPGAACSVAAVPSMRCCTSGAIAVIMTAGRPRVTRAGVGTRCCRTSRRAKTIRTPNCSDETVDGSMEREAT
uniref:Putative secreted protein n=1 Tax=Anopheles marajoara TaxID=58244 RepID=A0A2M4CC86_9DIPT